MKKAIIWLLVIIIVGGGGWLVYTRYGEMKIRKAKIDKGDKNRLGIS